MTGPQLTVLGWVGVSVCCALAWRRWRRTGIAPRSGMGLGLDRRPGLDLAAGFVIGALAMTGIFLVERALHVLRVEGLRAPGSKTALWTLIMPPSALTEELVFRGMVLNGLVFAVGRRWLALALMAFLFGAIHAANPNASAMSVLGNSVGGLVYGVAFLGSGRIWLGTGAHLAWNLVQGPILGFPVSGLDTGGVLEQTATGPPILTGGGYGPEAGVIGVAFRFVALALVAGWLSLRPSKNPPVRTGALASSRG